MFLTRTWGRVPISRAASATLGREERSTCAVALQGTLVVPGRVHPLEHGGAVTREGLRGLRLRKCESLSSARVGEGRADRRERVQCGGYAHGI